MGCVRAGDVAVLAVRVGVGATIFAHGAQKLFGWFGGGGLEGTAKGFEGMGYRPGESTALAAGLSEAAGGASSPWGWPPRPARPRSPARWASPRRCTPATGSSTPRAAWSTRR
ncbi:DoxX family membrane protein [Nocardiopsis composta]